MNMNKRVVTQWSKTLSLFIIACSLVVSVGILSNQVSSQGYQGFCKVRESTLNDLLKLQEVGAGVPVIV